MLKEIKSAFSFSYFTKLIINQAENHPENNCFSINQQEEKKNKIIIGSSNFCSTADTDLLKMVPIEKLLNFVYYFRTLQLGYQKFLSRIVFLHY